MANLYTGTKTILSRKEVQWRLIIFLLILGIAMGILALVVGKLAVLIAGGVQLSLALGMVYLRNTYEQNKPPERDMRQVMVFAPIQVDNVLDRLEASGELNEKRHPTESNWT